MLFFSKKLAFYDFTYYIGNVELYIYYTNYWEVGDGLPRILRKNQLVGVEKNKKGFIMDCKKEIFADGIGQVHFAGGMVRFDFVTLQPAEEGKAPVPESNLRIIMPPQGFLGAFNSMQQLIDKLVEAGVLQKNEAAK